MPSGPPQPPGGFGGGLPRAASSRFPWEPVIAGGAAIIGGIIGNRARSSEARNTEEFSERMRNTQWQAGVADMEAAGLNPALAYSQGGASSPSGALAQQSDVISPAVSTAQQARRMESELRLLESQEMKAYEDAKLAKAGAGESAARTQLVYKTQKSTELDNELRSLSLFSARNAARVEQTAFGRRAPFADRIRRMIFGGSSILQPIGGGRR